MRIIWLLWCSVIFFGSAYAQEHQSSGDEAVDKAFEVLLGRDFQAKEAALTAILDSGHARASEFLQAILNGTLMRHKKSKKLVLVEKQGKRWLTTDLFTGESFGILSKRKLKKIAINNTLRRHLNGLIAISQLLAPEKEIRLQAVNALAKATQPEEQLRVIRQLLEKEQDEQVQDAMRRLLALSDLNAPVVATRMAAIVLLSDSLDPVVKRNLATVAKQDSDPQVRAAADQVIVAIDERLSRYQFLETLFFGLSAGSVLVLAAIGLAITFGVMGVINMAHGELIMLGAYTTYVIQQLLPESIALALFLAIPAAFLVSGLMGIVIERGVIRFLYGRPLETLLATFGISLILQQLVRTVVSPQNVPVSNPDFMSGLWQINSIFALSYNRLFIILFCALIFVALFFLLKRTRLGIEVRAVAQNRDMARAIGVRSGRVDALTFGLGSGIAGLAGVALSQLTNVGPNLGQAYIVDSFMVVVFGGVGNLWGTLVSGLSLGVANKLLEPETGAVMAKILVLLFVILFIQKKPRGLFPQKGRAVEA